MVEVLLNNMPMITSMIYKSDFYLDNIYIGFLLYATFGTWKNSH